MTSTTPIVEGTYVYDIVQSKRGRPLNRLCLSLKESANRDQFVDDENAYCDRFGLDDDLKKAVLERDWVQMLDLGGSIFYIIKLAAIDKKSMQDLGGIFTGMTTEDFIAELRAGGRSFD
ncbi:Protocatechuate 4,5-dioxygenase alpha chain [Paeniglutamicibacter gangotriensis Lz1y]|uniref:Protocatechuate 4,5-dioxygenase alpha chain n=2 Tax=Paeniglutamicibacter gangotriensis TaxID=254787 RepID=M7MM83_9MICC|nr:Protocatechuate 4,5-dioxygenase alpha chain [Paeniglutamicibacter gangotriensis Lz1y]